ncbi:uncharacterized protein C1orf167 homolog [Notamacropus eugenii]|uniref:uncharacterized protein C1orf167 homolog n=1 Tax=Notamacropus eugenii TaxID=9315 RepID=UPI003B66D84F
MDANRKETMPPWPGGHLKSGGRLVQKNVSISLSVGSRRDATMGSCWTKSRRTAPAVLPGLGPGHRVELGRPVVSRQFSALIQTNLASAGQLLQNATSLVSNSGFEQQSNLQPRAWRTRASGKWRGSSFQQSNMKLTRADPERRGGHRSPHPLEEPDRNLMGCSRELSWPQRSENASWSSRPKSQTHGCSSLRDQLSSSFSDLGNTGQVSPKATKAQGSELSPPPRLVHQDCPVQPSPGPQDISDCCAPDPRGLPLTLEDLDLWSWCQQSAHHQDLRPRDELSLESARLLLSMRRLKLPAELLLLRDSQDYPSPWPHSNWATSPEASPTLTSGYPNPLTLPCRAMPPEAISHLTSGHPSSLTLSHSTVSPVISPNLTPGHASPLTLSHSTVSSVISPELTPGHSNPLTLSHSTVSPETPSNLTLRYYSPLSFPHGPVIPEVSSNLTPGYPKLHAVSSKTLTPEVSPSLVLGHPRHLILSHRAGTPEAFPSQTPQYPNFSGASNQVEFPNLKLEPLKPLAFSGSTRTPGNSTSCTLSHRPLTPDLSPSFPPLSLNGLTPGAPPNLTPGYSSSHSLSDKTTTTKTSPKLTPGYFRLYPHSTKTKVPEVSTKLMPGYPRSLTFSHKDVTPEISPSLGRPQGVQQLTRAFGIPETQGWGQDPGTKELGDFNLPSSGDGHGRTAPTFAPGTSGVNMFRAANPASFPQPDTTPCTAAFPQAFCDKLSLPSGRGAALGNLHQAVPAPMSGIACASGSQVKGGQGLMETQLEAHLQQIWKMLVSLVPQGTNTPLSGPKESTIPTRWGSPEGTSSGSGNGSRQSLLKNVTPEPHPSGQEATGLKGSSVGMRLLAQQQFGVALRPNEQQSPWMKQSIARNLGAGSQTRSDLHLAVGASQQQLELREKSSMEPLTPEAGESRVLLTRCFKAWQCHLLRQRAVARALSRRHLLRKGIRAMRWSLWLREAQIEYMKRKQGRTVLNKSFQKWKDLYLNRTEQKLLTQTRTETLEKDLLPSQEGQPERSFVTLGVVCGVGGAPKIQLHPRWKSGIQNPRAQASRDLHRLAVFHLWYLQKVLLAEIRQEAQAQAELGKKKLQQVFQAWRVRTMNAARICPLVTRHQRAQLGRCFGAWKHHIQRKTWCQDRLAHWRVETLRKSLHQWVKMVQLQATHSRTVAQLYLHHQRSWHLEALAHDRSSRGPVSQGPGEQNQSYCYVEIRAKDSLEEACRKLKLHRVVLLWSRRLTQHQSADSFSHSRKLRLLQNSLRQWWQKAQVAESPPSSSTQTPKEPHVGSQDSEESSISSAFLSSALTPCTPSTPRSSSEEAHRPPDSSFFLSLAGDDPPWILLLGVRSISSEAPEPLRISFPFGQKWLQFWEWQQLLACPVKEESGPPREAVRVPRDPGHLDTPWSEAGWQQGFQNALEARQHCQITLQSCVIFSWNLWAAAQEVLWELVCQQQVWGLAQEALHHWHTSWQRQQALQELGYQWTQHRPYILKRRVCGGWPQKVSMLRNATSCQEMTQWRESWPQSEEELSSEFPSDTPWQCAPGHFQAWYRMVLTALNLWGRMWTLRVKQRRSLILVPCGEEPETGSSRKMDNRDRRRKYSKTLRNLAGLAKVTSPQGQDWRIAVSQIYHVKHHCLVRPPWAHWNAELPRKRPRHLLTKEEEDISVSPRPRTHATHPQRLAIVGHHILCADPNDPGKQAGNYWTRATAQAAAKRKPHSHIGQRKKSVSLGDPKQSFQILSSPCLPLHCSSFQLWLQSYQRQSKVKGLTSQEGPTKSTRQQEGSSRTIQIPKSTDPWRAALLEETWLKRKYLQMWRHEVLLQRFHGRQRKKRLADVWQCWINAQGSEQLERSLVRQRWLEWGWGMWRKRWLQLQVALCLQEDHKVLSQAFGRWHQRWAARVPKRGDTSQ